MSEQAVFHRTDEMEAARCRVRKKVIVGMERGEKEGGGRGKTDVLKLGCEGESANKTGGVEQDVLRAERTIHYTCGSHFQQQTSQISSVQCLRLVMLHFLNWKKQKKTKIASPDPFLSMPATCWVKTNLHKASEVHSGVAVAC